MTISLTYSDIFMYEKYICDFFVKYRGNHLYVQWQGKNFTQVILLSFHEFLSVWVHMMPSVLSLQQTFKIALSVRQITSKQCVWKFFWCKILTNGLQIRVKHEKPTLRLSGFVIWTSLHRLNFWIFVDHVKKIFTKEILYFSNLRSKGFP